MKNICTFALSPTKGAIMRYYPAIFPQKWTCKGTSSIKTNPGRCNKFSFSTFPAFVEKTKSESKKFTRLLLHSHVFRFKMKPNARNFELFIRDIKFLSAAYLTTRNRIELPRLQVMINDAITELNWAEYFTSSRHSQDANDSISF